MTSMTIRMHPDFPLMGIIVGIGNYNVTDPSIWPALAYVLSQLPDMADKGLAGYSNLLYDGPSPIPGDTRNISGFDGQFLLANSTNPQDVLALWEPVIQHVMTTWPGWITLNFTTPWASFSDWYAANNDSTTTGTDALLGSRLLSRESLTTNLTAVAEAIADFTFLGYSQMNLVSGPGVHDAQPRGGNNSVNPGWRSSYVEGGKYLDLEEAPQKLTLTSPPQSASFPLHRSTRRQSRRPLRSSELRPPKSRLYPQTREHTSTK